MTTRLLDDLAMGVSFTITGIGWLIAGWCGGRAIARFLHVRHDAAWARTQLPDWASTSLASAIQIHHSAVGSMSRPACHGWAWMIAVGTPDGPVITTGHAWTKKSVDRRVAKAAERGWASGDRDLRLAEYLPEPPGE